MKRSIFFLAVALSVGAIGVGTAAARGRSAMGGRAADPSQAGCFWVNTANGQVSNSCSTVQYWVMALDTDSNTSKTVNVGVYTSTTTGNTGCRVTIVKRDTTSRYQSAFSYPATTGFNAVAPTTGGNSIGSQWLLWSECSIGPSNSDNISEVDWNN